MGSVVYPRVIPYSNDPNGYRRQELTISVEYLGMSYPDPEMPIALKTSRAGRTCIIIEGLDNFVAPYLKAIQAIREGVNHSHNSA
jgi:hypothetical protein